MLLKWVTLLFYLIEREIKVNNDEIEGVFAIKLTGDLKLKKKG
jgi:hypothetical protein